MGPFKVLLLLSAALLGAAQLAAAARMEQQLQHFQPTNPATQEHSKQLNTYYFDVTKPTVKMSESTRAERTAVTVTLSKASVSNYMAVVTPRASGMTHAVSNTWQALKVRSGLCLAGSRSSKGLWPKSGGWVNRLTAVAASWALLSATASLPA